MATTTERIAYTGTKTAATITIASLASSSSRLVGRESNSISNAILRAGDFQVGGKIKLGTSPTVSKTVELWCIAKDMFNNAWPDVFGGADAGRTITSENVKNSFAKLLWAATTDATTGLVLPIPPTSVADRFGFVPEEFSLFLTHDAVAALDATAGNHSLWYQPLYYVGE